jgi:hypothetical protein
MEEVNFDQFEIIISEKLSAKLGILYLKFRSGDMALLDAQRWERLICRSLLQLEEFSFQYDDAASRHSNYHGEVNSFTSVFWIERQWHFEVTIDNQPAIFSICPYKYVSFRL